MRTDSYRSHLSLFPKCLILGAFLLNCSSGHAEWRLLVTTVEGHHYLEDSIQKKGEQISFWRMTDFAKPLTNLEGKEVMSEKIFSTVDCSNNKMAMTQVTRYAGAKAEGAIMNHYETPPRFTTIQSKSLDAAYYREVCANTH